MAHRKSGGSASSFGSSNPKYRGVKKNHGQHVTTGQVVVRQKGKKYRNGDSVGCGRDHTLFALKDGTLSFAKKRCTKFTGKRTNAIYISVV